MRRRKPTLRAVAVFVSNGSRAVASAESAGDAPRVLVIDDEEVIRRLIQSSRSALATVAR